MRITKQQLCTLIREMAETFEDDANVEIVASDGERISRFTLPTSNRTANPTGGTSRMLLP